VMKGALKSETALFAHCDPKFHPVIAKRKVWDNGRKAASLHLNKTLRAAYIKDLYEDFSQYLAEIVQACARKGLSPDRFIGKHGFSIEANDLLKLGSWDAVIAHVSAKLFRAVESEKSTMKLISAIDAKLDLKLDAATCDAALPNLDLRHLLVHRDGVPDKEYCDKYPKMKAVPGTEMTLRLSLVSDARTAIHELARHIDYKIVSLKLVLPEDLQP